MALTTVQVIQIQCPALYADSARDTWISYAGEELSSCYFGSSYAKAIALLACHLYILKDRSLGESGMVTSKREGGLSLSYGGMTVLDDLDQTHYGKQLQRLIKTHGGKATVVGQDEAGYDTEEET